MSKNINQLVDGVNELIQTRGQDKRVLKKIESILEEMAAKDRLLITEVQTVGMQIDPELGIRLNRALRRYFLTDFERK